MLPNVGAKRSPWYAGSGIHVEVPEARLAGPVEGPAVDDHAADGRPVPADPLGRRVDDDVRPVLDRPEEERRARRCCRRRRERPGRVRHVGDGAEVRHVQPRVADRLHVDRLRRLVDGVRERPRIVAVHEAGGDAQPPQRVLEQREGAAVEGRRGDDGIARLRQVQQRQRLRRLPAGHRHRRRAALQLRDAPLEHVGRRVHDARVDVAELLEPEQAGRVLRPVEHVARGGVDRHRAGVGGGVGDLLRAVHGAGAQAQLGGRLFDDAHLASPRVCGYGRKKARPSPWGEGRAGSDLPSCALAYLALPCRCACTRAPVRLSRGRTH